MKRSRLILICFLLICVVLAVTYVLVQALSGRKQSMSMGSIIGIRVVSGAPRTIEVETRTGVCTNKEARHQTDAMGVKVAGDHEVFLNAPSTEQRPRYCLGQEVAVVRRLKLPAPASQFVFYDADTSPPTRLNLRGSSTRGP